MLSDLQEFWKENLRSLQAGAHYLKNAFKDMLASPNFLFHTNGGNNFKLSKWHSE